MQLPQLLKQEGLVTVVVMMLVIVPVYSEEHTTCTAITTVYNTSITCLFAEDISQLGFNVQFFFPNTSEDPDFILACNRQKSGGLACHKGPQILFDERQKIVDRFTLSRPPSLNKLKGAHYRCSAVRPLVKRSDLCPLTYKNDPRLVPPELPSTPHSEPPPPKDGNDAIQVSMLVTNVIMLILLFVMISAGFCLWAKRNRVALWCSRRAAEKKRPVNVEDATEDIPLRGPEAMIPEGLVQDYYNMRTQSGQATRMAGEAESGEIQAVAVEEATAMVGEGGPETEEARGSKRPGLFRRFWKFHRGGSDTSEHGARGESKEGNTRAGKISEDERETQERENREARGGQGRHGEEEGKDTQAKAKKSWWPFGKSK